MWFVVGAAVIGAGTSYMSSQAQSKAASKASQAAQESGDKATAAQLEMFYKALELDEPFREQQLEVGKQGLEAGKQGLEVGSMGLEARRGLKGIADDLYTRATDPESDPIYKFQERQLERGLAKRGLQKSGIAMEGLASVGSSEAMRREGLLGARRNVYSFLAGGRANGGRAGGSTASQYAMETGRGLAGTYQATGQGLQDAAYARGQAGANMWAEMGNLGMSGLSVYDMRRREALKKQERLKEKTLST